MSLAGALIQSEVELGHHFVLGELPRLSHLDQPLDSLQSRNLLGADLDRRLNEGKHQVR